MTVLAILAILLTILLAALTYGLSRRSVHQRHQNHLIASHLSHAGITRACSAINRGERFPILPREQTPNGGFIRSGVTAWGPHLLVISTGQFRNQSVVTTSLVGTGGDDQLAAAVRVCDETLPFVVAGNTRIYGDVCTGPLGMSQGHIKGEGVIDREFLRGNLLVRQTLDVPTLDTIVMARYLRDLESRRSQPNLVLTGSQQFGKTQQDILRKHSTIYVENNLVIEDMTFSSYDSIRTIIVAGRVDIKGGSRLGGLIEIVAGKTIRVSDSARIDEAILLSADSLVLSENACFSGTAIAAHSIAVVDRSSLQFPSLLLLDARDNDSDEHGRISLASQGHLETTCWLTGLPPDARRDSYTIYLDTSTVMQGVIVSDGQTDLRGTLYGSVATEQFHYYVRPTTYINWVKDLYVYRHMLDYRPNLPILSSGHLDYQAHVVRLDRQI